MNVLKQKSHPHFQKVFIDKLTRLDELQSPAVPSSPEDKQKEMRRKQIEKMREIAREHKANLAAVKEKKLQSNTTAQNEYPNDGNTEPEVHMNVRNSVSSHLTQETVASFEIVNEGDKEVDFTTASFTKRYEMEEIDDARQRVPKLYVVNKDDESSSSRPVSGLPTKHSSILLKDDQVKGSAVPYVVPKRKVVPPPEHEPPQAFHPMQHQTSMPNQHVSEHEPPFSFHTVHEPPTTHLAEPARRYESEHSYPSPGLIRKESDPRTMTESPGPYGNYTPSPGIARPVYQSLANYQSQSPTSPGRQSYQSLGSQNENVPDPYRKDIRTSYASLSTHEEHGGDRRTSYASLSPKSDAQSFTAPLRSPSPPNRVEFSQPAVQQRYPPRTHSAGQPAPQFRPVSHQYGPSNTVPPPRPQYAPYRQQAPQYANQPQPPVHLPSGSPPNRDPYLGPMNPNVRPYNGNGQYIPRPMGGTSPNFAGQGQMGRPMGGHSPNYPGSPPLGGTSPNYRVPPPMGPMGPPQQYRLPTQNQYPGPPPQNFNQHQGPPPQNFNQHPQNFNNQYPGNAPQNFGVRPNPGFDDHYDPSPIRVNPQNQRIPAPYPPGQLNSAIPAPHGHYPNDQFRPPNNYGPGQGPPNNFGPGQGPPNNFGPGQGPPRPFMPYRPAPPQQGFGHYPNQPYQPQRRPSDQR
ncbi:hypothetical protein BC833DRAFT_15605 [Globomyces pollinis-pini]|nr:hypothetical protein BC833DRAFT_15605 [Globomyces pollinis-pini]